MTFAAIVSTGGSVLARAATVPFVRERLGLVVADRECGALHWAEEAGVPAELVPWTTREAWGDAVTERFVAHHVDAAVVFFTRLLGGRLLDDYAGRLFNFHPSILPAFAGLHGVDDALRHGVKVVGTTVHVVDPGMDTGEIVLQTSMPVGPDDGFDVVRHRIFVDQCRSLVQLVHWLDDGVDARRWCRAPVTDARFVPALEHDAARQLHVPAYQP